MYIRFEITSFREARRARPLWPAPDSTTAALCQTHRPISTRLRKPYTIVCTERLPAARCIHTQ